MQRDLEETNFNTISALPIIPERLSNGKMITNDVNANETMNSENGNAQIIDSTA